MQSKKPYIKTVVRLLLLIVMPFPATAEVEFGRFNSSHGWVLVEEDLTTSKYPIHSIAIEPIDGSNAKGLILRCEKNKTEAYIIPPDSEFFSRSGNTKVYSRFNSEESSSRVKISGTSQDGTAAFISNPINFIARFAAEGKVTLSGDYYSGNFTGVFILDRVLLDGIYSMAETCQWTGKLPIKESEPISSEIPPVEVTNSTENEAAAPESEGRFANEKNGEFGLIFMESVSDANRKPKRRITMADRFGNSLDDRCVYNAISGDSTSPFPGVDYNYDEIVGQFKYGLSINSADADILMGGRVSAYIYSFEVSGRSTDICAVYFEDRLFQIYVGRDEVDRIGLPVLHSALLKKYGAESDNFMSGDGSIHVFQWANMESKVRVTLVDSTAGDLSIYYAPVMSEFISAWIDFTSNYMDDKSSGILE